LRWRRSWHERTLAAVHILAMDVEELAR
jgi:hypothetical protein